LSQATNFILYSTVFLIAIYLQICQLQIYVNHMQKLKLSDQEFAYMKALALFSPGNKNNKHYLPFKLNFTWKLIKMKPNE